MRTHYLIVFVLCAVTARLSASEARPVSIFDGKTLNHWSGKPEHWRVEDGCITGEIKEGDTLKGNQWIFWDGVVNDFDLTCEFKITGGPSANSGIQYRCQQNANGSASGYQADLDDGKVWLGRIYDEHGRALICERGQRVSIAPDGRKWTDVFAEPKNLESVVKVHDWNKYQITATASHVEVRINDVLFSVLDDHDAKDAEWSGKLAFQLHSGPGPSKIQFRNIQLTDLGKTEMPKRDIAKAETGKLKTEMPESVAPSAALNLGFEKGTLEGWTAEGNAWERQPVEGDTVAVRKRGNSQHVGRFWLGGYERRGDKGLGTLTSQSFEVTHPWASYLVGAAPNVSEERVEIVEEATGKVIHTGHGAQVESMQRVAVNLTNLIGKRIFIRIVDQSTRGWGHVNFDDFVFHDTEPKFAKPQGITISGDRAKRGDESPVLWHLTPNPAKPTSVKNEAAQKLVAGMKLQEGFQAELIAAEPDVKQPIAFCFDERGRLWVAEAFSYPNRQPEGQGKDRISIFEDSDGDGSFETHKIFCEGLNLISGIEVGFGGVWVGAAPYLLFIPRDGDRTVPLNGTHKAHETYKSCPQPPGLSFTAHILLDGFGYQDTHETLNSFLWGPDGWLYGNQGVFNTAHIGKPGSDAKDRIELRSGVWRYHPVRHVFEVFCHGGSNQWGLDYNSNGALFMTHCRSFWGKGGTTNAIRNGIFWNQSNANYPSYVSATAPDFAPALQNYLPASAKYDSGEGGAGKPGTTAVYGGHSHVGTMIYNGDNFPSIYRDHLFTHNLHGHQMNQQHMVREGSGYETLHAGYDLMFCGDEHYIPVDLQTGPDGAVYVIDWADTQHCHNPEDEKWDRTNGRIYRISWKATYKPVKVDLGKISDVELVNLLGSTNGWKARTALRLLIDPSREISIAAFGELENVPLQPFAYPAAQLRSVAAIQVFNSDNTRYLEPTAPLLTAEVRAWTIQLGTEEPGKPQISKATLLKLAKDDPSPVVRLALASAMPALPADWAFEIGSALAMHAEDKDDRFLPKMIWFGLADAASRTSLQLVNGSVALQAAAFDTAGSKPATSNILVLLSLADRTPMPSLADSIRWYACKDAIGRETFVANISKQSDELAERSLKMLAFALKDEATVPMPKAWPEIQLKHRGSRIKNIVDQLSALFGDKEVLAQTRITLADATKPIAARRAAFDLLKRVGDNEATPIFAKLLDQPEFTTAVIPLLARSNDPATALALLDRFDHLDPAKQSATLNTLTSRAELAKPLLDAVKAKRFDKTRLSALQVRQLRNLNNAEINALIDEAIGKVTESSAAAKATIAKLKKAYTSAPLWAFSAKSGEQTFQQVCAVCHAMGGVGGKLGPDLGGSWRNGLDYFLENIVDPNAVVGDNFQLHILTKKDGSVVSGLIENETPTALTVRTVTESIIVAKSDLKDHTKAAASLMPPGMLEALSEHKAIELLKYLNSKRE